MPRALYNPMGTTALITGASSGLGAGYAHELAQRGADLVLVARRQDRLEALAVDLAEKYGTVSTVIPLDLTAGDAVPELVADLKNRNVTIGTLVNSAGFGTIGPFARTEAARQLEQVRLNVLALTHLTHALLPDLIDTATRMPHAAALVNLASTAAFQPMPHMSVYAASKAYVLSFTESLWYETRTTGLKVTAICPGFVDTEFARVAGSTAARRSLTVDRVMDSTCAALDRGVTPPQVIVGKRNAMLARAVAFSPRKAVLSVAARRH